MNEIYCTACGRKIERLETYIYVNGFAICDECYMNMSTKEFIEQIGGAQLVKE